MNNVKNKIEYKLKHKKQLILWLCGKWTMCDGEDCPDFGVDNPELRCNFKTRLKYFIPKVPFNLRLALKILFGKCTIYNHYDNDYKVYISEIITDKKI